jgi:Anti-sigma-K factor rskA
MNNSPAPSNNPWSELLAGYVLGDLSSDDMILVQQYLDTNPNAIVEVEELQTAFGLLPLGLDDVPVPLHIKTNLFATLPDRTTSAPLKTRAQTLETKLETKVQTKVQQRWFAIAGSIAAVVIATLGLQSYQLQQEFSATRKELVKLRESQEKLLVQSVEGDRYQQAVSLMNRSQSRMLRMTGSGPVAGASGSVVITPDQNRALLMVEKMPPPPPGKVYHLWAVVNDQKIACIQFSPEADGRVFMSIPANRWSAATEVAITVEPEESGTQPIGEMVMSGEKI